MGTVNPLGLNADFPGITYWLANLTIGEETADGAGVIFGTSLGGLLTIDWAYPVVQEQGRRRAGRLTSAMMLPNTAAAEIPISFGLRRPNYCIMSACDTGSNVIGEASETIRRGDARAMVARGSEAHGAHWGGSLRPHPCPIGEKRRTAESFRPV